MTAKTFDIKFECSLSGEALDMFVRLFDEPCPVLVTDRTMRVFFPPKNRSYEELVGKWGTFNAGMENEPPMVTQPMRVARYQPQDGDGPAWVMYEIWNRRP